MVIVFVTNAPLLVVMVPPLPARLATVRLLAPISSVPALTVTALVLEPREFALARTMAPELSVSGPEKLLAPLRVRVPLPFFVNPKLPLVLLIAPENAVVTLSLPKDRTGAPPADTLSIVPLPVGVPIVKLVPFASRRPGLFRVRLLAEG